MALRGRSTKKILTVFGTRPEAIKLVPLIKAFERSDKIELFQCISAQHRDMLDEVLQEFDIVPHFDMNIMKHGQTLSQITAEIFNKLPSIFNELSPDMLLVQGDTSTAFGAALCAFYNSIPIAHVEAGLRTHDIRSPFPEEFNRRAISLICDIHFAPTEQARQNLISEGISADRIFTVGNTAIDAILQKELYSPDLTDITADVPYILLTVHRREQSEEGIISIFSAVKRIAELHPDIRIIFPVHKNPKLSLKAKAAFEKTQNVILSPPLRPIMFHALLRSSLFIITDSGGIQEEAVFCGKPTLVLRNNTERPEGLAKGNLWLVGNSTESIVRSAEQLFSDKELYYRMSQPSEIFGDGHASERIVSILEKLL